MPAVTTVVLRFAFAASLISFAPFASPAQEYSWPPPANRPTMPLWPAAVPDPVPTTGAEADVADKNKPIAGKPIIALSNVSKPTLTLYAPKGKANGAAVVVFPGGGYNVLAIDLEGTEVCQWLNGEGITCILVKYRVPNTGPYLEKSPAALEDAQRALGLTRLHAAEWHIDPKRIGVLGFSAGAHLAVALSTHYDKRLYAPIDAADQQSCRPDFAVVVYPGYLASPTENNLDKLDLHPTANTPPTFLVQAEDDPVHVENSTAWFLALKAVNVPAELHLYAQGGHGYGLRRTDLPVTTWPDEVDKWLRTIHILSK
jgi:acetyl esterase/lipase